MTYTQADFWEDRKRRGFSYAVTSAIVSLLPGDDVPPPPDPDPEPPGNSGNAPGQTKPPKTK